MGHLDCDIKDNIAVIKVNRPKVLNALNKDVLKEMQRFLEATALEKKVKAVILTGEGDKAFIAGADIKEMNSYNKHQILEFCQLGQNVANALETAPFLTIAAVNGFALGGGLEMALACDFIYASDKAVLGLPETTLGLIPGFGGSQRLSRAIGTRSAKELIMSGRKIDAKTAESLGIVNRVCSPPELLSQCKQTTQEILKNSFSAVIGAKNAINCGMQLGLTSALELERNIFLSCFETPERNAAMTKFLQKQAE